MTDRPPLSDIDYVAACEAAAKIAHERYRRYLGLTGISELDPPTWDQLSRDQRDQIISEQAATVDAVWPILHEAAYTAGQASILDGDRGGEA